ncbi:MAG TPA: SUMF1/EgtB/PvdO family nonheme iron enzyme, partial [Polyangiaceae bacterium]|nr:SUMF1/EgtB/PvdO family nonheme iron enzyme [Polyangiaceae bacterium]
FLEGRPDSCLDAARKAETSGYCAIPLWIRLRPISPAGAASSSVPRRPLGPALVRVPGGSFWMGSWGEPRDGPRRRVTVSAFELDVTEVTVAEYQDCVDAGACERPLARPRFYPTPCNVDVPGREAHPVDCVSFFDAAAYCAWAGKRLPSEEEWDLAARGTEGRRFPWGDASPDGRACWNRSSSCPVGSFPQGHSPLGVDDLAGNVREWTEAPFCPVHLPSCWSDTVTVRGGSWGCVDPECVSARSRSNWGRDESATGLGFRCARTLRRQAPPR